MDTPIESVSDLLLKSNRVAKECLNRIQDETIKRYEIELLRKHCKLWSNYLELVNEMYPPLNAE
jgi:hypothetical protein